MKHHRFLILDDQGPGAVNQGWVRSARVLQHYGFLRHVPEKAERGWIHDDVLVRVLSADWDRTGTGDTFDAAVELFERERSARERGEFDAFLCDINLSTSESPEESNMMDPAKQAENENGVIEFLNNTDMARRYQGDVSPFTRTSRRFAAGLDLLTLLPADDPRPKIVYSASDATLELRNYIRGYGRVDIRLVDVINGEFAMGSAIEDIARYFQRRQRRVLRALDIDTIKMLLRRIDAAIDWDRADIRDSDDQNEMWSIRTLFPREVNAIAAAGTRERAAEAVHALHDLIALDFRSVFRFFAGHPDGPQYEDDDRQRELAQLRELEFSYSDNASGYEPSSALELGSLQRGALRHLVALAGGNAAREIRWRVCARSYGLYPGDIVYVTTLLGLNTKHGGAITPPLPPEVEVIEQRGPLELCWQFETAADEEQIAAMVAKFERANRQIRENALSDQGMMDLAVIICGRYKGVLRYEGGCFAVTVQIRNGELEIVQSRHDEVLPPRICMTVAAPDQRS